MTESCVHFKYQRTGIWHAVGITTPWSSEYHFSATAMMDQTSNERVGILAVVPVNYDGDTAKMHELVDAVDLDMKSASFQWMCSGRCLIDGTLVIDDIEHIGPIKTPADVNDMRRAVLRIVRSTLH